ncbi:MAG: PASTA domain-containing protein [Elusimicrobia bacterium]|nr:PASTA domain-containing protein [Elusimicrobiota bacterium]
MKSNRIYGIEYLLAAVFLCVLAFAAFRYGLEGAVHNRKEQVAPDLRNKSIAGALSMLAPLNLPLMMEGEEFNGSIPIGSILRQRPPGGTKVREGKTIRVVVSQGGETVFTPSLSGLPLRNAEILLRQSQLALGEVADSYSLRLDKGLVLSQDPKAESSVEKNALVNVVVSGGPPPEGVVLMPEFLRKNIAEAKEWAAKHGVEIDLVNDPDSLFPYGTVLEQQPQADAVVSDSAKVALTISARAGGRPEPSAAAFHYQVPQGASESLVRIVLVDQKGERELFNGLRAPGSKIDLSVSAAKRARVKIFLNGTLVEERNL